MAHLVIEECLNENLNFTQIGKLINKDSTTIRNGNKIVSLFYCDPSASYQKGTLEKNHEYIRYFLPKESTFDNLSQEQVTLMSNHINLISRDSLKNLTPYTSSNVQISSDLKGKLNLKFIEPNSVNLNPILLKRVE